MFWSHTYNALEDIPALWATLGEQHNPGMALDWRRFLSAVAADYLALQADELRATAPSKPLTHNCMGLYPNIDYSRFGSTLDFLSWDN